MKLKGQLQWTDYLNSTLLHMQPGRLSKIVLYGELLLVGCAFIGGFYLLVIGRLERPISFFLPLIIFLGIYPLYRYLLLPNRVKKIFSQQKDLSSPFEMEFTDTALVASNEFGNSNRPWGNFIKWKENDDLLILYHSDILYTIIPKRIFTAPEQVEKVKAFLEKSNVPAAKNSSIAGSAAFFILLIAIIWVIIYTLASIILR